MLLEHNADVNIQDNAECTPLHWCAREGNENLCRLLLEHNADVNIQDKDGYTPLHRCALKGNENICRLLLEHNANVNIQDNDGYTPLHWFAFEGNENLSRLLLEQNAEVNIQHNDGCTILLWCAREGDENLCRLLLEHNADVNIQGYDGCTPLHLSALNSDCSKIYDLLAKYGVQNINICDVKDTSPYQLAVRLGNAQPVRNYVDLGADVTVTEADSEDGTELEILMEYLETEDFPEAERVKTLAVSHPELKATTSSRFFCEIVQTSNFTSAELNSYFSRLK